MQVTKDTPRKQITIGGVVLSVPAPYAEGHTLNANEAAALNQTVHENIGNNFRSAITKAKKAVVGPDATDKQVQAVTPEQLNLTNLQSELDKYVAGYEVNVRRGGSTMDPVEREARMLAEQKVKQAAANKGIKWTSVPKEKKESLIDQMLDRDPKIMEGARRRVQQAQAIANAEVAGLDLDFGDDEEEEQAAAE